MAPLHTLPSRFRSPRSLRSGLSRLPRLALPVLSLLAGAAVVLGLGSDAAAFSVKVSSKGEFVHWEERTVGYTIADAMDANVPDGSKATIRAMGSWSGTVGAPDLETKAVDGSSPAAPSFDHKNGIFFMKDGYVPAGRALAITVLTYDNVSGKIMDADVIVNGIYNFKVLSPVESGTSDAADTDGVDHSGSYTATTTTGGADQGSENSYDVYDLHHVVAHELGHSLGMNDEMTRTDDLMYRYSEPNDASMRQPAPDDIAGLAELYASRVDAQGNGCGSSTVSPKKPSHNASNAAMYAVLGMLLFLALRARNDRRARAAFVVAAAAGALVLLPTVGKRGTARAATSANGIAAGAHAQATVLGTTTAIEKGLFKTSYKLATTACNLGSCPAAGHGDSWGGTIGNITQDVGNHYAPRPGDLVDISFDASAIKSPLTALANPLAARSVILASSPSATTADAAVRVLTKASR